MMNTRIEQINTKQCDYDSQLIIIKNDTQRIHENVELLLESKDVEEPKVEKKHPLQKSPEDFYRFRVLDREIWNECKSNYKQRIEMTVVKSDERWLDFFLLSKMIDENTINFAHEVIIQTHLDPDNSVFYVKPYLMPGQKE